MSDLLNHEFTSGEILDGDIVVREGKIYAELEVRSDKLLTPVLVLISPADLQAMIKGITIKAAELKGGKGA